MSAELNDYFAALLGEPVSTPEPFGVRRAAERRSRRRNVLALAAAGVTVLTILGAVIAWGRPSATPPAPLASKSATPQPLPSRSATRQPPPSPTACGNTDVQLDGIGGDGYAGGSVAGYSLTDVGGRTCVLSGFMTLRAFDGEQRPLTMTIRHSQPAATITLAPGEVAYFLVNTGNIGRGYDGTTCAPHSDSEEMVLPGPDKPLARHRLDNGCASTSLDVSPFTKSRPTGLHS